MMPGLDKIEICQKGCCTARNWSWSCFLSFCLLEAKFEFLNLPGEGIFPVSPQQLFCCLLMLLHVAFYMIENCSSCYVQLNTFLFKCGCVTLARKAFSTHMENAYINIS